MKRFSIFLVLSIILIFSAFSDTYAQKSQTPPPPPPPPHQQGQVHQPAPPAQQEPDFQKILKLKRIFIKTNLNLSEKTAKKFWPIYDQFAAKENALHVQHKKALDSKGITREMTRNSSLMTDEQVAFLLAQRMKLKEQMLILDQWMYNNAKTILTPREILKLLELEQKFKNQCVKHGAEKQQKAPQGQQGHQNCPKK